MKQKQNERCNGAFVMGMVGAIFASPCSTPVLIAITAVVSTGQSIIMGILMLLLYSIGHSVLIILAGTFVGFANELSHSTKFEKVSKIIKIIMGILLMAFAAYLFWSAFA
ncbi:MAG: cytochrome c biogenesis protein CcdA [Christensenellaceae bacterium]